MARPGPYQIQAAIASLHDAAATLRETDWAQIASLYESLLRMHPSPVVELNLAVAVAMRWSAAGWAALADLDATALDDHQPSATAPTWPRVGRTAGALAAYDRALDL
jgi:RNA polymerase sigma-70 factor (ECF subfamily)